MKLSEMWTMKNRFGIVLVALIIAACGVRAHADVYLNAVVKQRLAIGDYHDRSVVYKDAGAFYLQAYERSVGEFVFRIDTPSFEVTKLFEAQFITGLYDGNLVFTAPPFGTKTRLYSTQTGAITDYLWRFASPLASFVYYQNGTVFAVYDGGEGGGGDYFVDNSYSLRCDLPNGTVESFKEFYSGSYFVEVTEDRQHTLDLDTYQVSVVQLPSMRVVARLPMPEGKEACAGFLGNSLMYLPGDASDSWIVRTLEGRKVETFTLPFHADRIFFSRDLKTCLAINHSPDEVLLVDTTDFATWIDSHGYLFHRRPDTALEAAPLYEGANRDGPALARVEQGEQITVLGRSGAVTTLAGQSAFWYRVRRASGEEGWVWGKALQSGDTQKTVDETLHTAIPVVRLAVSSLLKEPRDTNAYHPVKMFRQGWGQPGGWLEAVDGPGIGEYVEVALGEPILADEIVVKPGYFDSSSWKQYNRVKKLAVVLDGKRRVTARFADTMDPQTVSLGAPVVFSSARFIIEEIYRTSKWDATGISGIEFSYRGHRYPLDISAFAESFKVRPVVVPMTDVAAVATGGAHTMILKTDGTLWATGWNLGRKLADGTNLDRSAPIQVMSAVAAVAAGEFHTMILRTDGSLWAAGLNDCGQLANEDRSSPDQPIRVMSGVSRIQAGGLTTWIWKKDGTVWETGRYGPEPGLVEIGPIAAVSCLGDVAAVLMHDGTLWTKGINSVQKAATEMDDVAAAAQGNGFTMMLKKDGTLWAVGSNAHGQLGDGTRTDRDTPVQVMEGVAAVSAGAAHAMILGTDGTLWAMGLNSSGQLGDGTRTDRPTPVQVSEGIAAVTAGAGWTMILKTDGTLWATGSNRYGQLGDGTTDDKISPVRVMAGVGR